MRSLVQKHNNVFYEVSQISKDCAEIKRVALEQQALGASVLLNIDTTETKKSEVVVIEKKETYESNIVT